MNRKTTNLRKRSNTCSLQRDDGVLRYFSGARTPEERVLITWSENARNTRGARARAMTRRLCDCMTTRTSRRSSTCAPRAGAAFSRTTESQLVRSVARTPEERQLITWSETRRNTCVQERA